MLGMTTSDFEIRQADAVEALRELEPGSVHAIVTDPPYCSGGLSETGRLIAKKQGVTTDEWFTGDNMSAAGLGYLMRSVAVEAQRVLAAGHSLVVFCDWRQHSALVPAIESAGLLHRGLLVWDKGSMGLGKGFRPRHELAMHFSNGQLETYAKDVGNVIRCSRVHYTKRSHPCEKPVELLREVIRLLVPPGGLVVDPFSGSGSTGRAAVAEGRRFLGFDRDSRWSRLDPEEGPGDLFCNVGVGA